VAAGVYAADMPISRTLIFDYVGRGRLLSATSLNSMIMDLGAIGGPWVAGMLLANVGADAALYLLSATYFVAFAVLFFGKSSTTVPRGNGKKVLRGLAEGFSYLRRTPSVAWLVSLGATVPLAGVFFSMMPVYARDVLDVGAAGLGLMVAVYSGGALVASITMTARGGLNHVGRAVVFSAVVYAVAMIGFAFAPGFQMTLAAVFVTGMASTYWKNTAGTIVQMSSAEEMRGRVMSIFGMGAQMLALGWLIGGTLSTLIGNQGTLIVAAGLMIGLNVVVYTRAEVMRRAI
ncbi:MAG: MFS transporter, partial [Chloroflexi bacterium]|nr:MFS transporter [Chloroflexota bacterium]